jgi:hypothetical protein
VIGRGDIDYEALLEKYIEHVGECEGVTFVDYPSDVQFTDEERAELRRLAGITDPL